MPNIEMISRCKYLFQKKAKEFNETRNLAFVNVAYGGGKTFLSYQWMYDRACYGEVMFPCLVVCPSSLVYQWKAEATKHIGGLEVTPLLACENALERRDVLRSTKHVLVCNYDCLRSQPILDEMAFRRWGSVVIDEVSAFKSSETKRFKRWRKLLSHCPHRLVLSGVPILDSVENIWAQMIMLDHGVRLGTSFMNFRHTYMTMKPSDPFKWVPKDGTLEKLTDLLKDIIISIPKEVVAAELPPKSYVRVEFVLEDSVRKLYNKLKKEFAATLPSGHNWETIWAMSKYCKLHQIASGFFYKSETQEQAELIHTQKLQWIEDNVPLMVDEGYNVVIVTPFKEALPFIQVILRELKIKHDIFYGEMKPHEKNNVVHRFQNNEINVFVCTEQSAYQGLNLQQGSRMIFLANAPSVNMRGNMEDRIHRMGSEIHQQIVYYDLVAVNTVDDVIINSLNEQKEIIQELIRHLSQE